MEFSKEGDEVIATYANIEELLRHFKQVITFQIPQITINLEAVRLIAETLEKKDESIACSDSPNIPLDSNCADGSCSGASNGSYYTKLSGLKEEFYSGSGYDSRRTKENAKLSPKYRG